MLCLAKMQKNHMTFIKIVWTGSSFDHYVIKYVLLCGDVNNSINETGGRKKRIINELASSYSVSVSKISQTLNTEYLTHWFRMSWQWSERFRYPQLMISHRVNTVTEKVKTNKVHKFKLLLKWKECRSNGFFREMLEWKRRQMHTASRCINNHLTFYLCIRSLIKTFVMWFRFAIQGSKLFDAKVNDIMMSSNGRQHSIIHSFFPACHFLRACFDSNNAPNGRSRLKFTATEYIRFYVLRSNQIDRIRLKSRARSAYYKWFPVKFPLTRLCIDGAWVLVVFRSYLSIFAKGVFNHPDVLLLISYFHNNISIFAAAAHKNNNNQPHASKVHRY